MSREFMLRLEAFGGASIDACASKAVAVADLLQVTVMFDFNGVDCMACPGDSPQALVAEWDRLLRTPRLAVGMKHIARGCP